jgi:hypothetical protein
MAIYNMLLNEFLKEHRKVQEQGATIARQQASIAELQSTVALRCSSRRGRLLGDLRIR